MKAFTVLVAIGFIVGVIFVLNLVAYIVGGLLGTWAWVSNLAILLLGFVMIIATFLTLAERKWSAMIQDRIGPNRATVDVPLLRGRPLGGVFHVATDAIKMLTKEDFRPKIADPLLFGLGPILAFAPVLALFAVVPAGPEVLVKVPFTDISHRVGLQIANPNFGMLWVFAIASLAVYGTSLAGWASNNKFALLGGVRASSQMISYEVALGLGLIGVMMAFSSVQIPNLIAGQANMLWGSDEELPFLGRVGIPAWGFFLQPVGFIVFFAAAFAETKRAPFDVPEGESEIIGYFVEYSGMKFGLFMISEFAEVVILAAITTALFFGGWAIGFGFDSTLTRWFTTRDLGWLLGAVYATIFWVKVLVLCYIQLAIRWTFPRFRYDQIQTLGWKILLPLALANLFITGALILVDPSLRALAVVGFIEIGFILALTLRRAEPAGGHHDDEAHLAADAHGHAPAPLPGAAAASHH
ncbi:MAG TPA: complex I subunit 1 family protein [Myxococcaceae bacterium]|nr:complex I subunit 1 family protein [Myxococcaceae bacterium]